MLACESSIIDALSIERQFKHDAAVSALRMSLEHALREQGMRLASSDVFRHF
jgi:hypothetical protein